MASRRRAESAALGGRETMDTLIAPVLALAAWTYLIGLAMFGARIATMGGRGPAPKTGEEAHAVHQTLPPAVRNINANFNHLHEQPTLFYAVALALQYLQGNTPVALGLAWGYAALRVLHSFVQIFGDRVGPRFNLFMLSFFVLIGLTAVAALRLFGVIV